MLEDRHYMRQPSFRSRRSATVMLLIINVVAFVVQCIRYGYPPLPLADDYFALSVEGLRHGYVWQLLTFQFMHGGVLHLLLHCWSIYIFGRAVEKAPGQRRLPTLYFSSGIICGPFHALAEVLLPSAIRGTVVG